MSEKVSRCTALAALVRPAQAESSNPVRGVSRLVFGARPNGRVTRAVRTSICLSGYMSMGGSKISLDIGYGLSGVRSPADSGEIGHALPGAHGAVCSIRCGKHVADGHAPDCENVLPEHFASHPVQPSAYGHRAPEGCREPGKMRDAVIRFFGSMIDHSFISYCRKFDFIKRSERMAKANALNSRSNGALHLFGFTKHFTRRATCARFVRPIRFDTP